MKSLIPFVSFVSGLVVLSVLIHIYGLEHPDEGTDPAPVVEQKIIHGDNGRIFVEPNRVCGEFEAARIGIRTHFGLVCLEEGMQIEQPIIIGGNLLSEKERKERVEPLVDEIKELTKRRW